PIFLQPARAALRRRNRNPPAAVGLHECSRTDQLELHLPVDAARAWQCIDLVAYLLPDILRIEVEATHVERAVGQHQAIAARTRDEVPVTGGNRQPALVVDGDGGLALEHLPDSPVSR